MSLIYHIATSADWERARRDGEYTTSTIGKTLAEEGFIHASGPDQVTGVADMFYKDVEDDLVVLVIDRERVRAPIRDEPAGLCQQVGPAGLCQQVEEVSGARYPHIYGPLNADAVLAVRPLTAGPDGEFTFTPEP